MRAVEPNVDLVIYGSHDDVSGRKEESPIRDRCEHIDPLSIRPELTIAYRPCRQRSLARLL